jgi:hypothetical protein
LQSKLQLKSSVTTRLAIGKNWITTSIVTRKPTHMQPENLSCSINCNRKIFSYNPTYNWKMLVIFSLSTHRTHQSRCKSDGYRVKWAVLIVGVRICKTVQILTYNNNINLVLRKRKREWGIMKSKSRENHKNSKWRIKKIGRKTTYIYTRSTDKQKWLICCTTERIEKAQTCSPRQQITRSRET